MVGVWCVGLVNSPTNDHRRGELQRIAFFMRGDENDTIGYPKCLCSSGAGSSPQVF